MVIDFSGPVVVEGDSSSLVSTIVDIVPGDSVIFELTGVVETTATGLYNIEYTIGYTGEGHIMPTIITYRRPPNGQVTHKLSATIPQGATAIQVTATFPLGKITINTFRLIKGGNNFMSVYVPKYKGYIADAANIDFIRCDGKRYSCQEATATSITPSGDALTVNGGWSQFAKAFIESSKSLEASFTNAAFDMDMFEITNAVNAEDADSTTTESKKFVVLTGPKVELPFKVDVATVYVRGLALTTGTVAAGSFTAAYDSTTKKTTLTFAADDVEVGDEIWVSYDRYLANAHTVNVNTNTGSARGSVAFHFPVYSSGTDLNVGSFAA